jgi:hypothetical protein
MLLIFLLLLSRSSGRKSSGLVAGGTQGTKSTGIFKKCCITHPVAEEVELDIMAIVNKDELKEGAVVATSQRHQGILHFGDKNFRRMELCMGVGSYFERLDSTG